MAEIDVYMMKMAEKGVMMPGAEVKPKGKTRRSKKTTKTVKKKK